VALDLQQQREQAHAWRDRLPPAKLGAVYKLLEVMIEENDDGDLLTEETIHRLRESQAEFTSGAECVSMEEVLADFGLTMADFPIKE